MEQENILNEHSKQEYTPVCMTQFDTTLTY